MMSFKLTDATIRKRDAQRVCEELRESVEGYDEPGEEAIKNISYESNVLLQANQQLLQELGLKEFTQKLEDTIKQAPVFDVILPTYPHDSFLYELGGWFRESIHPHSLLNINVRRGIGGGVVLRSKNKLFDFSLRPKILAKKDEIPEVMRNV